LWVSYSLDKFTDHKMEASKKEGIAAAAAAAAAVNSN
jgi:hypothetical protein